MTHDMAKQFWNLYLGMAIPKRSSLFRIRFRLVILVVCECIKFSGMRAL